MHNCWQQLSTRWFKTKTCFNFLQNGLEAFIWKVKAEILACCFLPLGPNSARLAVCSNLTPTAGALLTTSLVSNHVGNHSTGIGTHKHRLKTKAYSNIFKTLHCPRWWNTCIRKHVCLHHSKQGSFASR